MRELSKMAALFFVCGIAMALGFRLIEWTVSKPETVLIVCIEDKGERNCDWMQNVIDKQE